MSLPAVRVHDSVTSEAHSSQMVEGATGRQDEDEQM